MAGGTAEVHTGRDEVAYAESWKMYAVYHDAFRSLLTLTHVTSSQPDEAQGSNRAPPWDTTVGHHRGAPPWDTTVGHHALSSFLPSPLLPPQSKPERHSLHTCTRGSMVSTRWTMTHGIAQHARGPARHKARCFGTRVCFLLVTLGCVWLVLVQSSERAEPLQGSFFPPRYQRPVCSVVF